MAGPPIQWGILGCGAVVSKSFMPAMQSIDDGHVRAVCSRDVDVARQKADAVGAERAYGDEAAFLADTDIDAVYIATPPALHMAQVQRAAAAGKHILVEKPMAMDAEQCQQMRAAAAQAGVHLWTCYYMRFNRQHRRLKRLIDSGRLGRIVSAEIYNGTWNPAERGGWRHDPALGGGGVLMDLGAHCIDLLRYLLGDVVEVSGRCQRVHEAAKVDEVTAAMLRFGSDALATMEVSFASPRAESPQINSVRVFGTAGSAATGPINTRETPSELSLNHVDDDEPADDWALPHADLLRCFHAALRGGATDGRVDDVIHPDDGLRAQQVMDAIYESDRTGQRVILNG